MFAVCHGRLATTERSDLSRLVGETAPVDRVAVHNGAKARRAGRPRGLMGRMPAEIRGFDRIVVHVEELRRISRIGDVLPVPPAHHEHAGDGAAFVILRENSPVMVITVRQILQGEAIEAVGTLQSMGLQDGGLKIDVGGR